MTTVVITVDAESKIQGAFSEHPADALLVVAPSEEDSAYPDDRHADVLEVRFLKSVDTTAKRALMGHIRREHSDIYASMSSLSGNLEQLKELDGSSGLAESMEDLEEVMQSFSEISYP